MTPIHTRPEARTAVGSAGRRQRHLHGGVAGGDPVLLAAQARPGPAGPVRSLQPGLPAVAGPRRACWRRTAAASTWCWCASRTGCAFRTPPTPSLESLEENARYLVSCLRSAAAGSFSFLAAGVRLPSPRLSGGSGPRRFRRAHDGAHRDQPARPRRRCTSSGGRTRRLYPVPEKHDPHGDELGHIPYTAGVLHRAGHPARPEDPRLARDALQGHRARLRRHSLAGHLRRGRTGRSRPRPAAASAPGVHGGAARRRHAAVPVQQEQRGGRPRDLPRSPRNAPAAGALCRPARSTGRPSRPTWPPGEELQLGLDSFIFVDDNPQECAEVQAARPEVLTLPLPADPDEIPDFLQHVWAFDRIKITEEDKHRTALYTQRIERARLEKQAKTLEEFIASLQLEVHIAPITAGAASPGRSTDPADQPDELHDHPADRGRHSGLAPLGYRRVSDRRRERPLRELRAHGFGDLRIRSATRCAWIRSF